MAFNEKQWRAALARAEETGVFYFYSTEEYQVRRWAAQTVQALGADADVTRVGRPRARHRLGRDGRGYHLHVRHTPRCGIAAGGAVA